MSHNIASPLARRAVAHRTSAAYRSSAPVLSVASLLLFVAASGCRCETELEGTTSTQKPATEQVEENKPAPEAVERPKGNPKPTGPRLVTMPGKGLSAIRFGATRETIERHMKASCEIVTENRCAYIDEAVEFFLEDDALVRIKAHRRGRSVDGTKDQYYGTFRGVLPPTIMMGLHRHVVLEEFGEPKKKEPVDPPGPDGIADRHFYDGIVLEYDVLDNGNTVLAAMEILPSDTAKEVALPAPPKNE